jgi:phosphoglycerate dehydrogenase-like enzyme
MYRPRKTYLMNCTAHKPFRNGLLAMTTHSGGAGLRAVDDPSVLRDFDALIANRERTRFTRELLGQLPNLRIIAQTGNHAYHIDLSAADELGP